MAKQPEVKKRGFFGSNRGETLNAVKEGQEGLEEGQQQGQEGQQQVKPPVIDWEADDNPYKKRYGDSQGQIGPIIQTLHQFAEYDHNTKSWKPKTQAVSKQSEARAPDDVEKLLEGYDPDFVKNVGAYFGKKMAPLQSELQEMRKAKENNEYTSAVDNTRSTIKKEFGDEFEFVKDGQFNLQSPLYKLADQILAAKYVAQFNPDGTVNRYTSPDAEYMATVEAYAILTKRSKQTPPAGKGKVSAIVGKGTGASGVKGKISTEEYLKLSNEQKDEYDKNETK